MAKIVEVYQLCKNYDELKAVNNLSFTVNQGDVYGFLGQNGAGKSTTIRMLLSLIRPSSGTVSIFGKDIQKNRSVILKGIGAVIEKPDLYKYLSAYDNLSIFARMSGVKVNRTLLMKQLEMVGLADRAQDKVRAYSQGMKQRLGIAVALVHNPQLIILDEPTNGLDPQGIADIRNLIKRLSTEMGKTVIISSHLLSEIELIATRMIIINKGQKIVEGEVAALLDPAHTLVEIDSTDNNAARQKISNSAWGKFLQGDKLQLMMNKADVPQLIKELTAIDIHLLSVNSSHSLENYFLSLTTGNNNVDASAN